MPVELPAGLVMVRPAHQMVAIRKRRERALEREDLQAVARQIEIPDDLRAEQAHNVGAHGVLESGVDLFGDGGTPEHVPLLEHHDTLARPGEVGGVDEAVVAPTDDDGVVAVAGAHLAALFLSGLKKGVSTTRALARRRWCSTVTSMWTSVPGRE